MCILSLLLLLISLLSSYLSLYNTRIDFFNVFVYTWPCCVYTCVPVCISFFIPFFVPLFFCLLDSCAQFLPCLVFFLLLAVILYLFFWFNCLLCPSFTFINVFVVVFFSHISPVILLLFTSFYLFHCFFVLILSFLIH